MRAPGHVQDLTRFLKYYSRGKGGFKECRKMTIFGKKRRFSRGSAYVLSHNVGMAKFDGTRFSRFRSRVLGASWGIWRTITELKLGELRWLTQNAHFWISSLSIDIHAERRITLQMLHIVCMRIVWASGYYCWVSK